MADNPPSGRDGQKSRPSLSSIIHMPDLRIAVIILVLCGVGFYLTTLFESVPDILAQNVPAEWFPRLLIWTILVLTLILPFEHLFLRGGREHIDKDRKARIEPMSAFTAALLISVVISITLFGMYAAMLTITIGLPLLWGERRLKIWIPYVIIFPGGVLILFTKILKVFFEPGSVISFLP